MKRLSNSKNDTNSKQKENFNTPSQFVNSAAKLIYGQIALNNSTI